MSTLHDLLGRFLPAFLATLLAFTAFSTAGCGDDASSSNVPDASQRDGDPGGNDAMDPADASTSPDADPDKSDAGAGDGEVCGGLANIQCGPRFYCDYPENDCGNADATGTCAPRPDLCQPVIMPVCGCDDRPYNSECEANQAGFDVTDPGTC
jgi:hypothetical protein